MVVYAEPKLPEIIRTGDAVGGLTHLLHGRQRQADQDGDDGNDDE
jgi:hypothetical protein